MTFALTTLLVLALIIIVVIYRKSAYYKNVFSDAHYREIHAWLARALSAPPLEMPSLEAGTAFQTSAGIALALSQVNQTESFQLHISISETRGITTHAIAGRVAFLIFFSLNKNKCTANLFFTPSGVHHIALNKDTAGWQLRDENESLATMKDFSPLPFMPQDSDA